MSGSSSRSSRGGRTLSATLAAALAAVLSGCIPGSYESPVTTRTIVSYYSGDGGSMNIRSDVVVDAQDLADAISPLLDEHPVLGSPEARMLVRRDAEQLARLLAASLTLSPPECEHLLDTDLRPFRQGATEADGWVRIGDIAAPRAAEVSLSESSWWVYIECDVEIPEAELGRLGVERSSSGWRFDTELRLDRASVREQSLAVLDVILLPVPDEPGAGDAIGEDDELDLLLLSCEQDLVFTDCVEVLDRALYGPYGERAQRTVDHLVASLYNELLAELAGRALDGPLAHDLSLFWPGQASSESGRVTPRDLRDRAAGLDGHVSWYELTGDAVRVEAEFRAGAAAPSAGGIVEWLLLAALAFVLLVVVATVRARMLWGPSGRPRRSVQSAAGRSRPRPRFPAAPPPGAPVADGVYDPDEAARFISRRTGIREAEVIGVLDFLEEHLFLAGISDIPDYELRFYPPGARLRQGELDPAKVVRDAKLYAGLDPDLVERVLEAEFDYQVAKGLIEPE